jgi:hypothetical protein
MRIHGGLPKQAPCRAFSRSSQRTGDLFQKEPEPTKNGQIVVMATIWALLTGAVAKEGNTPGPLSSDSSWRVEGQAKVAPDTP